MLRAFKALRGCTLAASDGEIGSVREFYFDDEYWMLRYFVVETGSWLSGRSVLIAPSVLRGVDEEGRSIAVDLTREQVRESPPIDFDKPVTRQHEEELQSYYLWQPYWMTPAGLTGTMPPGPMTAPPPPEPERRMQAAEARPETEGDPHLRSSAALTSGYRIHAHDGEIGSIEDFILEDQSWRVAYLLIHPGVWFFGKDVLLPPDWIERISHEQAEALVNLPRAAIKEAPAYDASKPIDRAFEQRLYDHYQRKGYWEAGS